MIFSSLSNKKLSSFDNGFRSVYRQKSIRFILRFYIFLADNMVYYI